MWDSGVERVEGSIASGEKIKVVSKVNPGRAFPVEVTEFTPGKRMTWSGGMPLGLFKGVRTFTLAPGTDGATRFTVREEYTGPLLPMIWRSMPDLARRSVSSPTVSSTAPSADGPRTCEGPPSWGALRQGSLS